VPRPPFSAAGPSPGTVRESDRQLCSCESRRTDVASGSGIAAHLGREESLEARPGWRVLSDRGWRCSGRTTLPSLKDRCPRLPTFKSLRSPSATSLQAIFYFSSSAVQRILKVGGARRVHAD